MIMLDRPLPPSIDTVGETRWFVVRAFLCCGGLLQSTYPPRALPAVM